MVDISFTMVMQWLNFGILLVLMSAFLFKPLLKFLDDRAAAIAKDIKEAVDNKTQTEELRMGYEKKIADIKAEADVIFEAAKNKALKEKDRILAATSEESARLIENGKKDIAANADKAFHELKDKMSGLVIDCTQKVLEREVKVEDHTKCINDFINSKDG